ncbi:phosphoribosylformylglycinamidine synthase subunit II [Saccharicrinis carchari]|uniref:Phosphoribosylformylglycinamidine synthase subunit PurL n=1 Tax=Saccharicrinis carchari TaxID=1168039 RepID=A0A521E326_SACCC|nr:phosphoribosylformylglycinamidine synthase subunit PurL [Saccharicrinis carchari]SMO78312.1 phosphoribosylformylglycinamidine synthase subunit II [Saccharicrinis carchari]
MNKTQSTVQTTESLNLTRSELDFISEILKRDPNDVELDIFSRLWTEHASYKNSLRWLGKLPKTGEKVIVEAGDESAGAVDIGDGYVCVFKIESHNHPCAIQPRLGALTGLRIVNRDVFSMGAKPVAFLTSLRFGNAERDTARWLFTEVVHGVKDFEKSMKVPVIGGEVRFDAGFNSSPIVNNVAIGIAPKEDLISGVAKGEGRIIVLLGALTGKDGVDTDAFSADFVTNSGTGSFNIEQMMDSTVERSLLEAVKKLNKEKLVVGIQTIGAGGIAGAATEMAARANSGIMMSCDKIPTRDEEMTDREILLSETWGRMLLCVDKENMARVSELLQPMPLSVAQIGTVTATQSFLCIRGEQTIADIPVSYVGLGGKAPIYDREIQEPGKNEIKPLQIDDVEEPDHYQEVIAKMMTDLNLLSREFLTDKFDKAYKHETLSNKYPSDASFVYIEEADKTLAFSVNCNSLYVEADPYVGTQIAVAQAARNIVCGGGTPLAVTDCLNFGSPYDPESFWQFTQAVDGLSDACKRFNTPVVSGNVSFYNQRSVEGRIESISPCPVVGMVGTVESKEHHSVLAYKCKGDMIFLIGRSRDDINASEYLNFYHKQKSHATPYFDIEEELELQETVKQIIHNHLVRSVHNVSTGGLFFNLLESAMPLNFGFDITTDAEVRKDAFLFGESQSRIIVTVAPEKQDDFVDFMLDKSVPFSALGHVTKGEIRIDDESFGFIKSYKEKFTANLKKWMEGEK